MTAGVWVSVIGVSCSVMPLAPLHGSLKAGAAGFEIFVCIVRSPSGTLDALTAVLISGAESYSEIGRSLIPKPIGASGKVDASVSNVCDNLCGRGLPANNGSGASFAPLKEY